LLNFKRNKKPVPKYLKQNKAPSGKPNPSGNRRPAGKAPKPGVNSPMDLQKVQKNITRQAILAGLTVVLTIVILFAMTSAWYTNIVQTSGLMFEAESWGFDGEINVNENPISAAPGDKGLIHLEVENAADSISAVSVNVSKVGMQTEMQKRLFFYVDTHMNRDGETMDRVYLNSQEGYTYTIFSNGNLTLTEKISNAPQLKWQWVYDVLGYYVVAQCSDVTGEDGVTVQRTTVQEYLRPIEYDYDEATIVMEEGADKQLRMVIKTVDGIQSPELFLQKLSMNDGYKGQIDPNNRTADGYYAVDVDKETGYGVYAYLCSYAEIQRATDYDTDLGELAYKKNVKNASLTAEQELQLSHKATLILSAQKNESKAVNVTALAGLKDIIAQNKADVIQLSENITIPADQSLSIPANTRIMLDLNGKTITCLSDRAIDGQPGSSLTLVNGTLTGPGTDSKTYGIYTTGSEVVMSKVDVNGFRYGVYMGDNVENNPLDSRVHMVDCQVDADYYAVFINGNGIQSEQKTQLIIENTTLTSSGIVLTCNCNADRAGTDIQILNSTISARETVGDVARGSGIYHPQKNSTMRIVGSTVSGYCGVVIKGGEVFIENSRIEATGAYQKAEPNNSGFTDTGDAVYIETTYGNNIMLEISGENTVLHAKATESQSLHVFPEGSTNVSVKIHGGTFDEEQPDEYLADGAVQTKEGQIMVVRTTTN